MKRIFASRRTRWAAIVILIVLPAMLAAYSVFEFRRPNSFGEDHGFLNFFANNSDWILGAAVSGNFGGSVPSGL